jgi:iron complex transport system ATP-binding protein
MSVTDASGKALLGAYGISFSWNGTVTGEGGRTLDEVSFEIGRGELVALIGPNGSGKSTLLKILSGLLPLAPSGGAVRIQGQDLRSFAPAARARMIAYVSSELRAEFPLRAIEAVALGRTCHGSEPAPDLVREAMERSSCWALRDRDVRTLSGGEKQLVLLARALAQKSRILLLDEALSRMDLHHQAATGSLLRELCLEGYSVMLVAHDLNLSAEWASRCILLRSGKLVAQGPIVSTLTEKNLAGLYPRAPILVASSPGSGAPKVFFRSVP